MVGAGVKYDTLEFSKRKITFLMNSLLLCHKKLLRPNGKRFQTCFSFIQYCFTVFACKALRDDEARDGEDRKSWCK